MADGQAEVPCAICDQMPGHPLHWPRRGIPTPITLRTGAETVTVWPHNYEPPSKRDERGRTYEEAMADTLFGRMAALNQAGRDFGNVLLETWLGRAIVAAVEHLDHFITRRTG